MSAYKKTGLIVGAVLAIFCLVFQTSLLGIYEDIFADQSRKSHLPLRQDIVASNMVQSGDFEFELQLRRPHQLRAFSITPPNMSPFCLSGLSGKLSLKNSNAETLRDVDLKKLEALIKNGSEDKLVDVFQYGQVGVFKKAFLSYQNVSYVKPEAIYSCPDLLTLRLVIAPEKYSYIIP